LITHRIRTANDIPFRRPEFSIPFAHRDIVQKELDTLLRDGVITYSNNPYNNSLLPIVKTLPDGSQKVRFILDLRQINAISTYDSYPLPCFNSIIHQLGNAKIFSKLDMKKSYFQIPLHPDDCHKTAFSALSEKYHFLRTHQGLHSAPATQTRLICFYEVYYTIGFSHTLTTC